jgi:Undecaprenyl-phosphate glucose phosphotransferase
MYKEVVKKEDYSKHSIRIQEPFVVGIIGLIDFLLIVALGAITYYFYPGWDSERNTFYFSTIFFTAAVIVSSLRTTHCYDLENLRFQESKIRRPIGIFSLVFLVTISLGFIFKISDEFSRIWVLLWLSTSIIAFSVSRALLEPVIKSLVGRGHLIRNIAVVGGGKQGEYFVRKLKENAYPWIRLVGVYDDRSSRISSSIRKSIGVSGNTTKLINDARTGKVDDIVIALPSDHIERIQEIVDKLEVLPNNINLSPNISSMVFNQTNHRDYGGMQLLNLRSRPMEGWRQFVKFMEDRIIALLIFLMILPVMAIIAILIKLDSPGPILFTQNRYGFNNKLIKVYKFRSMYSDQSDSNAEKLVTRNDSRITRLGAFLRRSSLDELPQFLNVLRGEMSIVGPRPHALKASAAGRLYDDIVDDYAKRHRVKPGITGWAQINGWRGETDTEEKIQKRVEYDLEYIENWSLILDLKIIAQTAFGGFFGKNAY